MYVIVFDIGGTDIKYGVMDQRTDKLVYKNKIPTEIHLGRGAFLDKLATIAKDLKKKYKAEGVGISCAGSVDSNQAKIVTAPESIPEFQDINFRQWMKEQVKLPCSAENDVNCFGLAEGKWGNAVGLKNYLTMTVGTGIGGAVVIDGNLIRGQEFNAGEFGRMYIDEKKFESLASVTALINYAKELGLEDIRSGLDVFNLFDKGNKLAVQAVYAFYHNLAKGVANLIYIFNPERILIGGGVSTRGKFLDELSAHLRLVLSNRFIPTARIATTKLGNDSGMYGAYIHFMNQHKIGG
ncbi:MAG TPA: ROK family protein [Bacilli bacterium]|nr:ROK family protein [Bacilli bacterium]